MDNFGTFAAWVSIVAVILAIPLSVIANLATPRVQAWWATTNVRRRHERIVHLKESLLWYENARTPEIRIDNVLHGLTRVVILIGITWACIVFPIEAVLRTTTHVAMTITYHSIAKLTSGDYVFGFVAPIALLGGIQFTVAFFQQTIKVFRSASLGYLEARIAQINYELEFLVDNSALKSETPTKPPTSQE